MKRFFLSTRKGVQKTIVELNDDDAIFMLFTNSVPVKISGEKCLERALELVEEDRLIEVEDAGNGVYRSKNGNKFRVRTRCLTECNTNRINMGEDFEPVEYTDSTESPEFSMSSRIPTYLCEQVRNACKLAHLSFSTKSVAELDRSNQLGLSPYDRTTLLRAIGLFG